MDTNHIQYFEVKYSADHIQNERVFGYLLNQLPEAQDRMSC